jgi:hypothetical protein
MRRSSAFAHSQHGADAIARLLRSLGFSSISEAVSANNAGGLKIESGCDEIYRGARLARMRCKVRRCMLSRRAVSETLRLHIS